jgi:hypothetical protein
MKVQNIHATGTEIASACMMKRATGKRAHCHMKAWTVLAENELE